MSKKQSAKKNHNNNPVVFRSGLNIGNLDAESDNTFLTEAFIEKIEVEAIANIDDNRCILIGRTGSGKTAIIKHLEDQYSDIKIVRIEPEAMALTYLSNSTILNYFENLGVKLELFYKTLWKHVFVIELLKLYSGSDQGKIDNVFERFEKLLEKFNGKEQSKKKALAYLTKWKDSFWQNIEVTIKEMEDVISTKLAGELNLKPSELLAFLGDVSASTEKNQSHSNKLEVLNKSQKIVNDVQIQEINEVIRTMKTVLFDKRKAKFFIVIDDLDRNWVDTKIVYDLLKNMIDAIKELKAIEGTKIVIALRENLLQLVLDKNKSRGFQREKYESLYLRLKWSEAEMKSLVEKRLSHIFTGKYAKREIKVDDVMRLTSDRTLPTFPYLLERTLMRPRDIIDFINKCIEESDGKSVITGDIIRLAENKYSKSRLRAVEDEWIENYPFIADFVNMLREAPEHFNMNKFKSLAETYCTSKNHAFLKEVSESDFGIAVRQYSENVNIIPLIKYVLIVLYETGVIGIKLSGGVKASYSYLNYELIAADQLSDSSSFTVHKAFHKALQINTSLR